MSSPSLIDSEKSSTATNPLSKRFVMCSNPTVAMVMRVHMRCVAATESNVTRVSVFGVLTSDAVKRRCASPVRLLAGSLGPIVPDSRVDAR